MKKTLADTELKRAQGIRTPMLYEELGRALSPEDIGIYLELDVKTVRAYYAELGGIRLGRRILFFEKEVINAIQKRSKMGSPSESEWEEEGKDLPEQERSSGMGKRKSVKSRGDLAGKDRHSVLV